MKTSRDEVNTIFVLTSGGNLKATPETQIAAKKAMCPNSAFQCAPDIYEALRWCEKYGAHHIHTFGYAMDTACFRL